MDKKQEDQVQEVERQPEEIVGEAIDLHEDCKKLVQVAEEKYKRALADYQNLQRRVQEEKSEWIRTSNKNLILKFLPVLGTLMLAQKHLQDKGLQLSIDQFLQLLQQEGAERIDTIGKDFDPLVMECVETRTGEDWKVLEEVRSGYKMGDIVLQPAQVVVGKEKN